ncbi:MAG TPA: SIMPL domain-containing protein [Caulobacteraceae bacterium]|jgi:hypothetical protein
MRRLLPVLLSLACAGAAAAQTPPATIGERYVPAPWWMREPVIASVGHVRTETPANRARFAASFQVVDRTAEAATGKAAEKVRELGRALAAYGAERARVETTFSMQPIFDQYRDKEGNLLENRRPDKIEAYQVSANVAVEVRDPAYLERVYATVLAARPSAVQPVSFGLEPSNEITTWLAGESVKDAARRARMAAEAAGSRLGPVRVIDPSGRACETDVLAGWPSYGQGAPLATDVDAAEVMVRGSRVAMAPPPPPPPPPPAPGMEAPALLPLQPPLHELTAQACVVYALGPG